MADPSIIPGLTQAQAAEVDPKTGVVWISVSAASTVFRYDPAETDPNAAFKTIPNITGARSISINPGDGTVWIGGLDVVKKISADGSQVLETITGVHEPEVAVNPTDGSCWVTDSRGTVTRYDANGAVAATAQSELKEPKFVAVNPKTGNAWVADSQASVLVKLSPTGQELLRITDIPTPTSPHVNSQDGSVWLVSSASMLVKLSPSGQKIKEVPAAGMAILAISIDGKDGSIWVADQLGSNYQGVVTKFSASGQKLFENPIPMPSYVSVGNWAGQ
jgi:DNA-binding beta-propeller fold protein YncE